MDGQNLLYWQERIDLAAAFRWTARLNMHEAVANHFSLSVNDDGTQFLMNPNQKHFSRIKASDMLLLDANDPDTMNKPGAPDPTAWGLHGSVHRKCPHAKCVMHVHSIHATVLASLSDSRLPPIDQNTAIFYERYVIDEGFGGLAFEDEGMRCAGMLQDPKIKVMIMGNHGVLVYRSKGILVAVEQVCEKGCDLEARIGQEDGRLKKFGPTERLGAKPHIELPHACDRARNAGRRDAA